MVKKVSTLLYIVVKIFNYKKIHVFLDLTRVFVIIVLMFFNVEEVDFNEDDIPTKKETEI